MAADPRALAPLASRIAALRAERSTDLAPAPLRVPAADFADPANHCREVERLFLDGPVVAGLSGDAAQPGDWFTVEICGRGVFLIRGDDGVLGGFHNACPHRGMRLVDGCGQGDRRIVCPYHAWSFDRVGRNTGIPFPDGFPLDAGEADLTPVQVVEASGIVYVSLGGGALNAGALLGGIDSELAPLGLQDQVIVERQSAGFAMNWKLGIDSYMEAYHLHFLHRDSLRPFFFNDASPFDAFGPNSRIGGVRRSIESADLADPEVDLRPHLTLEYQLFPNAVLIFQQDHFELSHVFPDATDPGRCRVVQSVYAPAEGLDDARRERFRKSFGLLLAVTATEDFGACEQVQANLAHGHPQQVILGRNEPALIHFHRQVHTALGG